MAQVTDVQFTIIIHANIVQIAITNKIIRKKR